MTETIISILNLKSSNLISILPEKNKEKLELISITYKKNIETSELKTIFLWKLMRTVTNTPSSIKIIIPV